MPGCPLAKLQLAWHCNRYRKWSGVLQTTELRMLAWLEAMQKDKQVSLGVGVGSYFGNQPTGDDNFILCRVQTTI